jgi:hypothetical protein
MNRQQVVMDTLFDLYQRINNHNGDSLGTNMLERYNYFVNHSEKSRECTYALKCLNLFFLKDYNKVKELLLLALQAIRTIEGDSFGR